MQAMDAGGKRQCNGMHMGSKVERRVPHDMLHVQCCCQYYLLLTESVESYRTAVHSVLRHSILETHTVPS